VRNEAAGQPPPEAPAKPKLSWGEKRDRRRRRRKIFEEAMGWLLVPALLYGAYLLFQATGGIPKELQEFAMEVFAMLTGSRGSSN
jgi:hypothetical protein